MRKAIVIISLSIVVLAGVAVIALPSYVQHRAIAEAAARGITLTIDHTRLGFDGIALEGVGATTARMPNAHIHVDEIDASWDSSPVIANGVEVTGDGPVTPPNAIAEDQPVPSTASGPTAVHVQSAHIAWTHFAGDATLDVKNLSGDFSLVPHVGDAFAWVGTVAVAWNGSTIGPLATQVARDEKGDHARISMDPADPASETFSIDHDAVSTRYELVVVKRAVSKLGMPVGQLGIALAGDPVISLHVVDAVTRPAAGPATATGLLSFSSDAISLPQVPQPVSASVDMSWQGNPDQRMPVTGGKFRGGPFDGAITGSVSRPVTAVAVDLAFASNTVPCSQFAASDPATMLGGTSFGAFAAMAGVKSAVVGDVKIAGSAHFDSRNPASHQVSFTPTSTCGVSISLGSGAK